jgi:Na+-driven multidrug efflux pump
MISQNMGAKRQDRAKKVVYCALIYSFVLTAIFMSLYLCFGKEMFMLFSDDTEVHELSSVFIRAILWMFPAFAVMRGSGAFIQGIGHARMCMILALLDGVVLRIGLSWIFGVVFDMGFFGIVLGYALAPYGYAVPSMIYFLSGKWKNRKNLADEI